MSDPPSVWLRPAPRPRPRSPRPRGPRAPPARRASPASSGPPAPSFPSSWPSRPSSWSCPASATWRRRRRTCGPSPRAPASRAASSRCPRPGPPPFRGLPRHADASARRAAALLQARRALALVASPAGLLRPSLAPRLLETRVVSLRAGDEMTPEILLEALDEGGYVREDPVDRPRAGGAAGRHPRRLPLRPRGAGARRVLRRHGREPAALRPRHPARDRSPRGPRHPAPRRRLRDALGARGPAGRPRRALRRLAASSPRSSSRSSAGLPPEGLVELVPSSPGPPCRRGRTSRRGRSR